MVAIFQCAAHARLRVRMAGKVERLPVIIQARARRRTRAGLEREARGLGYVRPGEVMLLIGHATSIGARVEGPVSGGSDRSYPAS